METNHTTPPLIELVIEKTEEYIDLRGQLIKLKALDRISEVVSEVLSRLVVLTVFGFFFVLLNIGICIWLGHAINSLSGAFLIMASFYLLLGIVLWIIRKRRIKTSLTDLIIKYALK